MIKRIFLILISISAINISLNSAGTAYDESFIRRSEIDIIKNINIDTIGLQDLKAILGFPIEQQNMPIEKLTERFNYIFSRLIKDADLPDYEKFLRIKLICAAYSKFIDSQNEKYTNKKRVGFGWKSFVSGVAAGIVLTSGFGLYTLVKYQGNMCNIR